MPPSQFVLETIVAQETIVSIYLNNSWEFSHFTRLGVEMSRNTFQESHIYKQHDVSQWCLLEQCLLLQFTIKHSVLCFNSTQNTSFAWIQHKKFSVFCFSLAKNILSLLFQLSNILPADVHFVHRLFWGSENRSRCLLPALADFVVLAGKGVVRGLYFQIYYIYCCCLFVVRHTREANDHCLTDNLPYPFRCLVRAAFLNVALTGIRGLTSLKEVFCTLSPSQDLPHMP